MSQDKHSRATIFVSQLSRNYPHCALMWARERVREAIRETIWVRVIASRKLPQDSGESIVAARH